MEIDEEVQDLWENVNVGLTRAEKSIKRKEYVNRWKRSKRRRFNDQIHLSHETTTIVPVDSTSGIFLDEDDIINIDHANHVSLTGDEVEGSCHASPISVAYDPATFENDDVNELFEYRDTDEVETASHRDLLTDVSADEESDSPDSISLWDDLRDTVLNCKLSVTQIDDILKCLNRHPDCIRTRLPNSYKTLLGDERNPVQNDIKNVSGHAYYYFGLRKQLAFYMGRYPKDDLLSLEKIEMVWSTDGLPLFNSSHVTAWPVLAYIANLYPRKVFEIVLTVGIGKPDDTRYLNEFLDELQEVLRDGIEFHGRHFLVVHKACVCDAPARAFIKHTKQFSASVGCDMCEDVGTHDGKRVVWEGVGKGRLRTDLSFRSRRQSEYHKNTFEDCRLLALDIDMVRDFPPDFMHQGGGTMKKMLNWLIKGPKKNKR